MTIRNRGKLSITGKTNEAAPQRTQSASSEGRKRGSDSGLVIPFGSVRWMGAAIVVASVLVAWPAFATQAESSVSVPVGNVVVGHQSIVIDATASTVRTTVRLAVHPAAETVHVWTRGFQTQINECRGAVDVTDHYGVHTIAEHWSCGGKSFPIAKGSTVTLTGLDAGTYTVLGVKAVLNARIATTRSLPRGYQLLFQTCRNGNSATTEFIALQAD